MLKLNKGGSMNFNVIDNSGETVQCDVIGLFSYHDKNFIIYTDNNMVDREKEVYASLYKLDKNNMILLPITSDEDWELVDKYLEDI